MSMDIKNYSRIEVAGRIKSFTLSHEHEGIKFYKGYITTAEKQPVTLPLIINENLFDINMENVTVSVKGSIRSKKFETEKRIWSEIFIFVEEIREFDNFVDYVPNKVEISGYLCKRQPLFMRLPKQPSLIYTLAVPRRCGNTSYLICKSYVGCALNINETPLGSLVKGIGKMVPFVDRAGATKYEVHLKNIKIEEGK